MLFSVDAFGISYLDGRAQKKGKPAGLPQIVTLKYAAAGTGGNFITNIRCVELFVVYLEMNYTYYEQILSAARMNRYRLACNGNERKTMTLYRLNIRISQDFFGILSIWEIAFRNAVDTHYKQQTGQRNWLQSAVQSGGMFATMGRTCRIINDAKIKLGRRYSHDRLVAELSFGFWVELFNRNLFNLGGQSLHLIFIQRPAGSSQQSVYQELSKLRDFRNRIAHHEPICFNLTHQKSATYVQ